MQEHSEQVASARRAIVFAGGDLDPEGPMRHLLGGPWHLVICADAGTHHALRFGLEPTEIVGDMDSISPEALRAVSHVEKAKYPRDKEATDSQLAVERALAAGAGYILIAGGIGSRFDHSLANAHLLALIQRAGGTGAVTDGRQSVYLLARELVLTAPQGFLLSVIPITEDCSGLDIVGVRWELDGYEPTLGDTRTISNEFTNVPARLSLRSGMALIIVGPGEN